LLLRSNCKPVSDGKTLLDARIAEPNEVVEYENAKAEAPATEDDEILLVYLIPLGE
jgi:hypothetical protein